MIATSLLQVSLVSAQQDIRGFQAVKGFYDQSWALLVGINKYKHGNNLNFAVNDVNRTFKGLRLMCREGICAKMVKKFKMITDSDHTYPVFPNLLKQNFYAPGPNQVWVSDITYNPNRPRVAVSLRSGGPVLPTDCGVCH